MKPPPARSPVGGAILRSALAMAACAAACTAAAQPAPKGIELAELIRAASLPKGATQPPAWDALDGLGLRWKTPAPVASPKGYAAIGPLWRQGELVLLDKGKPVYQFANGKPGTWTLLAFGARSGPVELQVATDATSEGGAPGVEGLKSSGYSVRVKCEGKGASDAATVYLVGVPGRMPLNVMQEISAGSRGQTHTLTLPYTRSRVAAAQCR